MKALRKMPDTQEMCPRFIWISQLRREVPKWGMKMAFQVSTGVALAGESKTKKGQL